MKIKFLLFPAIFLSFILVGQQKAGLQLYNGEASDGYILLGPLNSTNTYLINNCGRVVHTWESERLPANEVKLLPNGWLLRCEELENPVIEAGGGGGIVSIYDENSEVIWEYEINNDTIRQHHDATFLPNGNVLILAWKRHSKEDAIDAGRNPDLLTDSSLWSEIILEVKPEFPDSGSVVWYWDSWDHHVQDFDPEKLNFGDVSQAGKINLNFFADSGVEDWLHANGIDYNESLDQIIISIRTLSEVWIIDHSTTTREARTSDGGNFGRGGDLLYRWGNPAAYQAGNLSDQQLFNQHGPNWVKNSDIFNQRIIIFNNNNTYPEGGFYSSVVIVSPQVESNSYLMTDGRYLPELPDYSYSREGFLSRFISGAEVLPNGNIFVCSGAQGHIFELNAEDEIVWSYINPVSRDGIYNRDLFLSSGEDLQRNTIFRAHKYSTDYSGLENLNLIEAEPIEGGNWFLPENCTITSSDKQLDDLISVYPNPAGDRIHISVPGLAPADYQILNMHGQLILSGITKNNMIDVSGIGEGMYILRINSVSQLIRIE